MRVRRPLPVRTKLLASAALVGLLLAGVAAVVQSAFTSTYRNSGNTFQAGSIALSGSVDRASALFNLTGMKPGPVTSRCIKVTYDSEGGLASTLKIHGSSTGTLGQYLRLRITRGSFPGAPPAGAACTGFAPSSAIPMYDGTLPQLPTSWNSGLTDSDPNWTDGEDAVYRIDVELTDRDEAQGATGTHELVFEARTNS